MKIIKPKAQIIEKKGLTPYQFIEKIGRTCYKSEDKITQDSAVKFVKGLCRRKHYAMIEHHWVHLIYTGSQKDFISALNVFAKHMCNCKGDSYDITKYMNFTFAGNLFISAPLRVFFEIANEGILDLDTDPIPELVDQMLSAVANEFSEVFPYKMSYNRTRYFKVIDEESLIHNLSEDLGSYGNSNERINKELMKHITHTVLFTCDRGVSHELVRHRPCSFAQESTRYCNYSKDKFGEEITVILPLFFDTGMGTSSNSLVYEAWKYSCEVAERKYFELLNYGATPQEARSVLPNSLKTEIIVTANETEWQHIINLRYLGTTGAPHPQMKEVMSLVVGDLNVESEGRLKYEAN